MKLHRLFNDNDVQFYCCSYDELDLGDEQALLYLDPLYCNTFDKYTSDVSNSNDFEGVIAENDQINLPRIMTVSVKDFTNTTKPAKNRVEIIATNL